MTYWGAPGAGGKWYKGAERKAYNKKDPPTRYRGVAGVKSYWPPLKVILEQMMKMSKWDPHYGSLNRLLAHFHAMVPFIYSTVSGRSTAFLACQCSGLALPFASPERSFQVKSKYCKGDTTICDKEDEGVKKQLNATEMAFHMKRHRMGVSAGPLSIIITTRLMEKPDQVECEFEGLSTMKVCRCSPGWKALSQLDDTFLKMRMSPPSCGCPQGTVIRDLKVKTNVDKGNCKQLFPYVDVLLRTIFTLTTSVVIKQTYGERVSQRDQTDRAEWVYTKDGWRHMSPWYQRDTTMQDTKGYLMDKVLPNAQSGKKYWEILGDRRKYKGLMAVPFKLLQCPLNKFKTDPSQFRAEDPNHPGNYAKAFQGPPDWYNPNSMNYRLPGEACLAPVGVLGGEGKHRRSRFCGGLGNERVRL